MDLSQMRTLVRRDLKDEDPSDYRWEDDEIDRAIARAVAELSGYAPRELTAEVPTAAGSYELDISGTGPRLRVEKVEFPLGRRPPDFVRFSVFGDTVTMLGDVPGDGSPARIYYTAAHVLDGDTCTVPAHLEGVVALGAAAYAVLALARYTTGTAGIGGAEADGDYRRWGLEMLREFRRALKSRARDSRVRASVLYPQGEAK